MIEGLQKGRHVQGHDAAHERGDGEDDGGDVDGEAGVVEEGVEHDADALAAVDDAEAVESDDEEELRGARETGGEVGEEGEDQRGDDLEGEFVDGVLAEEGLDGVSAIVVFAVEGVLLGSAIGVSLAGHLVEGMQTTYG